jgi:SPP1 family predicted phage head-tail adaptor
MRAGKLRTRIIIESASEAIDSVGFPVLTWTTFATIWGGVVANNGKEFLEAREVHSSLSRIITMRYLASVTPQMRINDGGVYYNILAVFDPDSRGRELRLYCDEQL